MERCGVAFVACGVWCGVACGKGRRGVACTIACRIGAESAITEPGKHRIGLNHGSATKMNHDRTPLQESTQTPSANWHEHSQALRRLNSCSNVGGRMLARTAPARLYTARTLASNNCMANVATHGRRRPQPAKRPSTPVVLACRSLAVCLAPVRASPTPVRSAGARPQPDTQR